MNTGGLAQMPHPGFAAPGGLGMPVSGLASRRGGQNLKPLSVDALKSPIDNKENGVPTPRTSRSHLLAGLRTAPKSATAATFPTTPTVASSPVSQIMGRSSATGNMYEHGSRDKVLQGPKTALPRYNNLQQQQQPQPQGSNGGFVGLGQQYTPDQILAPPEIHLDEQVQQQMDPDLYARLVATNMQLAQQQQRLQQHLLSLQQAAQQFQGLNISGQPQMQHGYQSIFQQQQQVQALQQQILSSSIATQPNIYAIYDPVTGQQTYYVDQSAPSQLNPQFMDRTQNLLGYQQHHQQQATAGTPRLQVSPPPMEGSHPGFRHTSPPRRFDSPVDTVAPLPPPSANAFRRGHKKSSSLANVSNATVSLAAQEPPKSAGPKTASFPLTPLTGGYGPGQARAGEHPVRQPRGPPSFDELASKPTAKHEGSKNFAARTRRSAVHNLMRAGLERRKGSGSSSPGTLSPVSEVADYAATPLTDSDSDSGRSGSRSLNGDDVECSLPSSRTSTGSWGAIGSDRPSSRQKERRSSCSVGSALDGEMGGCANSFANVFKNSGKPDTGNGGQSRKAPMLVLTSAEKRKSVNMTVA
ncbi:CHCH domain-containing protein [Pleurostoma richardsiae]|uniref:CHCH domain-containing protein n=1 Tax=Pleurostoma richardsiae TaxID=41990 RepID=A0AA38VQJ5_9PEZI|nr:CHCH domain-containing protein [Pleurostoma richardsiae]